MSKVKNFIKKARLNLSLLVNGFFSGMKSADEIMTSGEKVLSTGGTEQQQKLETTNVYAALIRGEVTQEVKDLRYGMYQAAKKADEYQYIGNGVVVKKNTMLSNTNAKVENVDNLRIVLTQWNHLIKKSISESMDDFINGKESDVEHRLKIERKYYSRFKMEDFAYQLVVKEGAEGKFILDFYTPIEPLENDPKAIYFSKEVKNLYKTGSRTSDLVDFDNVNFITEKAFPIEDMNYYEFNNLIYLKCIEFNGAYIFRFAGDGKVLGKDVAEEMYDEISKQKYEEKAPREQKSKSINEILDEMRAEEEAKKHDEDFDINKANDLIKNLKKS